MTGISVSGEPAVAVTPTQVTPPTTPTVTPPVTSPTTAPITPPAPAPTGSAVTPPVIAPTLPPFFAEFKDPTLKELAQKKNWADTEAMAKSYAELERLHSSTRKAGAPTAPTDYKFDVPADLPAGVAYSKDFETAFKSMAHAADLSPEQAAKLHGEYVKFAVSQHGNASTVETTALTERVTKAATDLETALGANRGTAKFTQQVELAKRAIRMTDPGMMDVLKDAGVIVTVDGQDMVANAKLFAVFSKMGAAMYSEDKLFGEAASADVNPFADATQNLALQGHYMRNDPEKAKLLITAAGAKAMSTYQHFLNKK